MFDAILGAVTGPIGGLIGGELDRQDQRGQESRDRQQQDLINQRNYDMQKEFAQMGIRWRAEDARAAGLHPLAAIGANVTGASPSYTMQASNPSRSNYRETFGELGQNISRAINATATMEERAITRERIRGAQLDNTIKEIEIRKLNSSPPLPLPTPGQPSADWVESSYPSVAYMRSPTGLVPIMPPNLAEALESDQTGQGQWLIRYRGGPNVNPIERPAKEMLPPGKVGFIWNIPLQEWQAKSRQELEDRGRKMAENKWSKPNRKYNFKDLWKDLRKTRR